MNTSIGDNCFHKPLASAEIYMLLLDNNIGQKNQKIMCIIEFLRDSPDCKGIVMKEMSH